jgi:signal transduction histidine kinase
MKAGSRAAFLAGILTVLALGIDTSRLAAAHPDAALGGGAPWESAVQVGAAIGATAAGLALTLNRRVTACGVLLALTGPAILLAQLPAPDAGSALLFTAALAGGSLAPFLAGSAALACPVRRLRRAGWIIVALSLAVAGVIRGLLPAAVFDPRAAGCFSCATNLAEVHGDPALAAALQPWGLVLAIALGGCLAAGAGWRLLRAPRIVALINAPLVLGGMAVSLLAAAAAAHTLQLPTPEIDPTLRTWWLAQCCLIALMAAGVAAGGLRARRLARKITRAVLTAAPEPESLRATLAACIGDPDLALAFPRDDGTVIDAAGLQVGEADRGLAVVRVTRADAAVAEIRYRQDLAGASHQLAAAVRAAGLAVEQVAARVRLRAELADLAASRQRIVELGDAERQRLERDLHDGAQQRLIALQMLLERAAAAAPPPVSGGYSAARRAVGVALEELRDLAHGIHPAALSDGGLRAGLQTLAETSPVPLIIKDPGPRRQPAAAEAAAYRMVADTVRAAGQNSTRAAVTVTLSASEDVLRVRLNTAGLDREAGELILAGAQDRVAALDGSITLASEGGQMIIEAAIPCVS